MGRFPLLLLGVLALSACDSNLLRPPPPPLGEQLKGEQIKATLSGNSLVRIEEESPPLVLFFAEDGELRGVRSNHYQDRGTWRIEDDAVCGNWNSWYGTLASCWEVYRAGDRFTLNSKKYTRTLHATVAPGNVAGLQ